MKSKDHYSSEEIDSLLFKLEKRQGIRFASFHRERLMQMQSFENSVKESLTELKVDMKETKEQTKITNGRVNKLEMWRFMVVGFCACLAIVMLPLLWALISTGKL